jgi:exopolysaccharide biosynthesis protein
VLFAVIDGRQPHSLGATLYDLQEVFLEHGAIIAANLDGGSSSVLIKQDLEQGTRVISSPSTREGERALPTAFLVFDKPDEVRIDNVWANFDWKTFDPAS